MTHWYRYGHSQIKGDSQVRRGGPRFPVFPDLAGFRPLASEHVIDWTLLFDVPGHPPAQRAKPIDGQLPTSLIRLPQSITGVIEVSAYRSLAARDLSAVWEPACHPAKQSPAPSAQDR